MIMLPDALYISADLGQRHDYTAIALLERRPLYTGREESVVVFDEAGGLDNWSWHLEERPQLAAEYWVTHLERWRGEPYTVLPDRLQRIEQAARERWQRDVWSHADAARAHGHRGTWYPTVHDAPVELVVDSTGLGQPIVDFLKQAGCHPTAIVIHGGDHVIRVRRDQYRTPKRDLVGVTQVALQNRRLRIAAGLPHAETLRREFESFRVKISLSGRDAYAAGTDWRSNPHDDLLLAVTMGVWLGKNAPAQRRPQVPTRSKPISRERVDLFVTTGLTGPQHARPPRRLAADGVEHDSTRSLGDRRMPTPFSQT